MINKTLLFIFHAHVPYIKHSAELYPLESAKFFEMLSYGVLPFLRMCSRLQNDSVPFKCALVISPLLCEMLKSPFLQDRYIAYLNAHIDFAQQELDRSMDAAQQTLIQLHLDALLQNRDDFIVQDNKNILKKLNELVASGYIELLATSATPCFFPFYQNMPDALAAQIELGLSSFQSDFSSIPAGFWLPAMGYNTGLDYLIKHYGIDYTVLESQSFLFADRPPVHGVFSSASSECGLSMLGKDTVACAEIMHPETGAFMNPCYLNTDKDIGFELDGAALSGLFDVKKGRRTTGFCYYRRGGGRYDGEAALHQAEHDAEHFLMSRNAVLSEAAGLLEADPLCSVVTLPLHFLGKTWFEGMHWLEAVWRKLVDIRDMDCELPADYLKKVRRVQSIHPFYASSLPSGYADELINSSNDWLFPRIQKATERMVDLAKRFPDDQGLKERTLNLAAKEVLLAQSIDWPLMTNSHISAEYAVSRCQDHIDTFTSVYESLGSASIGTDRLIKREKEYPLFQEMNYRFFIKRT